jgi:hypothetical protein
MTMRRGWNAARRGHASDEKIANSSHGWMSPAGKELLGSLEAIALAALAGGVGRRHGAVAGHTTQQTLEQRGEPMKAGGADRWAVAA